MNFDLKQSCTECPFIKGSATNMTLSEGRLDGIVEGIRNDGSFTCHKTTDLPSKDQQHCAGALVFLEREGRPNQLMRIAERIGVYDHKKLKMDVDLIDE